jgi:hypothetical protein
MMLTKMILSAASQKAACVMSCHRKSTGYPFFVEPPVSGGVLPHSRLRRIA